MSAGARRGFTLVEVIVALMVLELGLVGCVATLLLAARVLNEARRLHVATQTATGVADSLLAGRASGGGERLAEWGRVRWTPGADGMDVRAEDRWGGTLVELWIPMETP